MNRLEAIRANYVRDDEVEPCWHSTVTNSVYAYGDVVVLCRERADLLLAVAEAAAAYAAAREEAYRIGGDYGDIINTPTVDRARLGMSEQDAVLAMREANKVMDDAEETLLSTLAPLLEEVE